MESEPSASYESVDATDTANVITPEEHVFRSAPMTLVQLYFARDISRSAVGALGELGCVHFRDLNEGVTSFQRQFVAEIRKLDEYLRAVHQLEDFTGLPDLIDDSLLREPLLSTADIHQIGTQLVEDAQRLGAVSDSYKKLVLRRDELIEEREVLRASNNFFGHRKARRQGGRGSRQRDTHGDENPLLESYNDEADIGIESDGEFDIDNEDPFSDNNRTDAGPSSSFTGPDSFGNMSIIAGTVEQTRSVALERLCWRATRGNLFFARHSLPDLKKDVFMVYTHGSESAKRVRRLAESLECRVNELTLDGRSERLQAVNSQLDELFAVIEQTAQSWQIEKDLVKVRVPSSKAVVFKEKRIYTALNLCSTDMTRQGLLAEGWIPSDEFDRVKNVLNELSQQTAQLAVVHKVSTSRTPPTHHTTNKVTAAFQAMVDVYGIARYGEVNPGLPTIVTFPFMFAVMFGDLGHGFILTLGALALVLREKKIGAMKQRDELFDMAYNGRYVLLFMGLFSMYTGILYNDLFSRSMTIFNSAFEWPDHAPNETVRALRVGNGVYPIGLDWVWHGAENNLRFTNSYKMKLSVLLGFVHMTYSLCFQLVNAKHESSWIDIWGNFVPSMLFMQSIFGYLSLTIVYKWCVNWIADNKDPPGLLDMLIKMFLSPGSIDTPLYRGQAFVQCILVAIALICVPWLLLFKPLYIRRQQKTGKAGFSRLRLDEHTFALDEDEGNELDVTDHGDEFEVYDEEDGEHSNHISGTLHTDDHEAVGSDHAHESFGDIMIHQVIHTIEFCLNCISHTASYLRLWALSLAHNQLSQVLWNMTLQNAFGPTGGMGIFMVVMLFGMWFTITVLVLVCMEGTSAMLHALRLHWVEAMSKHFIGEGYAFQPLNLYSTEAF